MMKNLLTPLAVLILAGTSAVARGEERQLFNGADLTGWDGAPGWWHVEDGALTAESTPQKPCTKCNYLIWKGGRPSDFELTADFRISKSANSGIQIRSETRPDWDTWGYQADMTGDGGLVGFIYHHQRGLIVGRGEKVTFTADGQRRAEKIGDPKELIKIYKVEDWNTYRIVCRGPETTLYVNGVLMSQVTDRHPTLAASSGIIALQMHPGPPMKAQFKNIVLKTSKPGDADFPAPTPSARHAQKVAAVRSGDYDLVLVGDSITHTLQDFGGKYAPLNAVWAKHFAPRRAINLGYSGYRTENILWNLQNGELEFARSPELFMVLIGTNNTDDRHFPRVHTPEEIYAGTKAIVDLIRKRHPTSKVLLLRIFPRGGDSEKGISPPEFKSSAKCIETCRRAGELTAQLADGKQVFWLDINRVFLKADGTINTELMWDLLHPSPAGAEAWAQAVEPTVTRLMGDNAQKKDR